MATCGNTDRIKDIWSNNTETDAAADAEHVMKQPCC